MEEKRSIRRPPVVVVLGHVDHGKTTLLDKIRNTSIQTREPGGITQNIYISEVLWKGSTITFVDTPGHEVFSIMRLQGGQVADLALLIIAADEGVRPQTKESLQIISQQGIKYIVVITKTDKEGADPEKIKNELVVNGIYLEGFGGDIPYVEVSAVTGKGIDQLLDLINLYSEVENILDESVEKVKLLEKYGEISEKIVTSGIVLDSAIDKNSGKTTFFVLKSGGVKRGDNVCINDRTEKVSQLFDANGKTCTEIKAGHAGIIKGLSTLPEVNDPILVFVDDKSEKQYIEERRNPSVQLAQLSQEDLMAKIFGENSKKVFPIVIKADVKASLDSVLPTLSKFSTEELDVTAVKYGVGNVSISDVDIAKTFSATVFGFRVKTDNQVNEYAKKMGVEVLLFDTIYKLYEYLEGKISKSKEGETSQKVLGKFTIKQIFPLSNGEIIAGGVVAEGEAKKGWTANIYRNNELVNSYIIKSIRVLKEERSEVKTGIECGINIGKADVVENDVIEFVAK